MAEILNDTRQMQALFEKPEQYDAMLEKGIGITGNDKHYFINGRTNLVLSRLKNQPRRILDFGCGIGDTTQLFANRFPASKIVGSDLASEAIHFAALRFLTPNLEFVTNEALFHQNPFDLIYLNCVFHHIPPFERPGVASHLFELTEPGGWIWVFENNPANPGTQLAMYTNPFDKGVVKIWPNEQRNLLKNSGFQILETTFLFWFPQWLGWFRPLEKWLNRVPLGGQYGVLARKPF